MRHLIDILGVGSIIAGNLYPNENTEITKAVENGIYVPSTVLSLKVATTLNCSVENLFQLPQAKTNK